MNKRLIQYIIFLTIIFFLYSCNVFSPEYEHFDNISLRGDNKTVKGSMQNFVYSYTFKDSFLYEDLLHDDFTFEYDNDGTPETWNRDEDIRITKRIFRNFKNIDLMFNVIFPEYTTFEDTTIYTSFNIGFYSGDEIVNFTGFARFIYQKVHISEDSSVYKIKYWEDLR